MEFEKEYLGVWIPHDDKSCNALRKYDDTVDYIIGVSPYKYMQIIAIEHGTTIEDMKKHWRCIEKQH